MAPFRQKVHAGRCGIKARIRTPASHAGSGSRYVTRGDAIAQEEALPATLEAQQAESRHRLAALPVVGIHQEIDLRLFGLRDQPLEVEVPPIVSVVNPTIFMTSG